MECCHLLYSHVTIVVLYTHSKEQPPRQAAPIYVFVHALQVLHV